MIKILRIVRLSLGGAILGYAVGSGVENIVNASEPFGVYGWGIGFLAGFAGVVKAAVVA